MKTKLISFVILRTQKGGIAPLMNESGSLATFEEQGAAQEAGSENPLGEAFGFEVFFVEVDA